MAEPIRIGKLPLFTKPLPAQNSPRQEQSVSYFADFSAEQEYIINLSLQQGQQVFGVPRSIQIDANANPNNIVVRCAGTQYQITIPAYANGIFPIDALPDDVISFYSLGGATDKVSITIFNHFLPTAVWYTTDPLAPGFDVQALPPIATGITNRNTALLAGVAANVFPAVATPRSVRFTNLSNEVVFYQVNVTATGNFAAGDKIANPGELVELPYRTAQRISFFCASAANIQAEEWVVS